MFYLITNSLRFFLIDLALLILCRPLFLGFCPVACSLCSPFSRLLVIRPPRKFVPPNFESRIFGQVDPQSISPPPPLASHARNFFTGQLILRNSFNKSTGCSWPHWAFVFSLGGFEPFCFQLEIVHAAELHFFS